jgi:putative tryptophan/tyrosine transport system substrate-binding protein
MSARIPRRLLLGPGMWLAVTELAAAPSATRSPGAEQVLIITTSGIAAYDEVLDQIRKSVTRETGLYILDLARKETAEAIGDALRGRGIKVAVAIGADAAEAAAARPTSIPLIAALTPKPGPGARANCTIPLHLPLSVLLENVRLVFPDKSRLGVIHNSSLDPRDPEFLKNRDAAGFSITIADCAGPAQLLQTLAGLKGRVDLVLCFTDSSLYNSATIKPLVLASLRYRLPLVGFSESFARAGAALSVYPDFREAGVQAAELVRRALSGQALPGLERPRKIRIAVNQNITRLLGIGYTQPPALGDAFLVIR